MPVLVEPRKQKRFVIGAINTDPYPAHLHDVVETVVLRKGFLNMTVNGEPYCLEPNMILMVFPGVVHSYESASEDAAGLFVGFVPELISEFQNILITRRPADPAVKIEASDRDLADVIEKLESISRQGTENPLAVAYIHLFIACMFMKMELVPAEEISRDRLKYSVMSYIQQHSDENLTLDSVAKEMGIGISRLSHLFSREIQVNFRQYLNRVRIEKACRLLQEPAISVKEVCFECGFESTRTFHRAFLNEQKMTPGEYRRKMLAGLP